jgi:hypothetical protein
VQTSVPAEQYKLLEGQLGRLLDLYKHHFDLFLKGTGGYIAVLGFVGSAIFREPADGGSRKKMWLIMALASSVGVAGCLIARIWVRSIRGKLDELSGELQVPTPPLHAAEGIVAVTLVLCSIFLLCGLGYAFGIFHW